MTLESALITLAVIAGLGMLIYTLIETVRLRIQVVPEEERLVIYRLGRFNRIAGPGLVHLIRRQDSVHQTILVRDRPVTSTATEIMIYGVPFGYTLSFWCRTDLQLAAQEFERARQQAQAAGREFAGGISKQEFLTRLAVLPESERREQINTKVREGLINAVAQLQNEEPLLDGGDFAQALLPILPGLPPCDRLLAKLRTQLVRTLPTIGVFFNEIHPITVMTIHLGDDITGSFSRNRMVTIMKERFPNLSEQELMQALSSIQGFEQPERRIHFDGNGANTSSVEMRDDEDSMRYKFYPGGAAQGTSQSGAGKPPAPPAVAPSPTPDREPPLSRDDLNILKQVPQASSRARAASAP
jgi:hypothetical protein